MKSSTATFLFILLIIASPAFALDASVIEQLRALQWATEAGTYPISGIEASITTSENEWLLQGDEAHEYMRLAEGHDGFKPDALVVRVRGPLQDTQVIYTYQGIGYVKTDDWEDLIDPAALLQEISQNTAEDNKAKGESYPAIYADGWAEAPYLDKQHATVYWAVAAHTSEGSSLVNAKALKLGRKGFTEIVWMGPAQAFTTAQDTLSPVLTAYEYNEGSTYADFVPGKDTVAAVGVGALAYKLITGNVAAKAGAGLMAVLLVFAKKLWFLVFLPFVFAWRWFKRRFVGVNERA